MGVKNKVIAGDYEGTDVSNFFGQLKIIYGWGWKSEITLNKDSVEEYEVMDETSKKSVVSAVGRAFVGGFLLGPAGLLAGVTAKSKGSHIVAVQFKDGKKSLLQLNDKFYAILMKNLF